MTDLLSKAYADERRALIGEAASLELRPGAPGGRHGVSCGSGAGDATTPLGPAGAYGRRPAQPLAGIMPDLSFSTVGTSTAVGGFFALISYT